MSVNSPAGMPEAARSKPKRRRLVTIADVAERAGVSIPTVSKVINGRSHVSPQTRQRVEDALREHGYHRRSRSASRNQTLELLFHRLESEWALEIIRGVQAVARDNGLGIVISESPDGRGTARGWIDEVVSRCPVGMISVSAELTGVQLTKLEAHSIPLVVVDPAGEPVHRTPSVGATNWSGGYAATRHLLELGHRRIAAISGPDDVLCARARLDGYRAAMDAAGVPTQGLIRSADFKVEDGRRVAQQLLGLPEPPTAVVTGNDLQAFGVYEVARQQGLRIPEELSVVGFDDLPVASWLQPALTTIRQPLREMAGRAAELVVALGHGETPQSSRIELSTELVGRESTAPPRARSTEVGNVNGSATG